MKFKIWGLTGTLATEHEEQMAFAEQRLWHWIDSFDAACNRFRSDSEISRLNAQSGQSLAISPTLELAIDAALRAGEATGGLCDPTVLPALIALGYDRDYDELLLRDDLKAGAPIPAPGLGAIHLDRERHVITLDPGCQLDLGASAKALIVDLVAHDVAPHGGVVVELGGDVAALGNGPDGPWVIGIADRLDLRGDEPRVSIASGAIATSSLTTRTWRVGSEVANHIIDPRTGTFARSVYATSSVSASSCVIANAFATAALLWGEDAGFHIAQAGWSARLVRNDGTVDFIGGWPEDDRSRECLP
ncbi:MAG TPA: FAD:protein FMN transferase [Acidimicrobiales bacterium]|nr:FAD:protein FMN transferase [Acidimicrobiales bacterium]